MIYLISVASVILMWFFVCQGYKVSLYIKKEETARLNHTKDIVRLDDEKQSDDSFGKWLVIDYFRRNKDGCTNNIGWKKDILFLIISIIVVFGYYRMNGVSIVTLDGCMAIMMLASLSVVDWKTQYIPAEYNIVIGLCGLIRLVADTSNWLEYIIGLFLVSGFLYVVNKVATPCLRKKYEDDTIEDVIGDGDMKLMAATGLLLGWKLNFVALGLGCVIGSIIQIVLMKVKESDRQFALGPYLSLGVYITMICGEQLVSWYLNIIGITPM